MDSWGKGVYTPHTLIHIQENDMNFYGYIKNIYYAFERKKEKLYLKNLCRNGLKLGNNVEIVGNYFFDPSHCFLISIGDNCTICPNVRLIAHDASIKKLFNFTKIGRIEIKENCFIGDSTIVLQNVTIGENSIIGAGSVVTKNIAANMVAAGNPAKQLMTVKEYKERVERLSKDKKIFSKEYYIDKLDNTKRIEMIESLKKGTGFIV